MTSISLPIKIFLLISALFFSIFFMAWWGQKPDNSLEQLQADDTLLIEAKNKAKANLAVFDSLYKIYPNQAFIRFKFLNDKNKNEHVWGKVKEKKPFAFVLTNINENDKNLNRKYPLFYDVTPDKIEDWIIELAPDKYWGGYTTQVILIRKLQSQPDNKIAIEQELNKFADPL